MAFQLDAYIQARLNCPGMDRENNARNAFEHIYWSWGLNFSSACTATEVDLIQAARENFPGNITADKKMDEYFNGVGDALSSNQGGNPSSNRTKSEINGGTHDAEILKAPKRC